MKNKIIALILAAVLCISVFSACGNNIDFVDPEVTPSAETETPVETEAPAESVTVKSFDYQATYESYAPETVVMTVNGDEITWKEYFGWLFSILEQYEMYLGTEIDWSSLYSETQTLEDYAKEYASSMCAQYSIVAAEAEKEGIELSAEDEEYIANVFANDALSYTGGDVDAFAEYLESTFMDTEYYYYVQACILFYSDLFEKSFGVNGANFTDEDVNDFLETNGFLYAKHILFLTQTEDGTSLDDAAKAEKLAQAEDVLAQLKAAATQDDMLAKFDELMNSLSEDTGLASYPDGYYFQPGEMVTEFEEGTKALEFYDFSEIIESPYGYHIILRLPIGPEDIYSEGVSFRYLAAQYAHSTVMSQKFDEAEIVYSAEFENFSIPAILKITETVQ